MSKRITPAERLAQMQAEQKINIPETENAVSGNAQYNKAATAIRSVSPAERLAQMQAGQRPTIPVLENEPAMPQTTQTGYSLDNFSSFAQGSSSFANSILKQLQSDGFVDKASFKDTAKAKSFLTETQNWAKYFSDNKDELEAQLMSSDPNYKAGAVDGIISDLHNMEQIYKAYGDAAEYWNGWESEAQWKVFTDYDNIQTQYNERAATREKLLKEYEAIESEEAPEGANRNGKGQAYILWKNWNDRKNDRLAAKQNEIDELDAQMKGYAPYLEQYNTGKRIEAAEAKVPRYNLKLALMLLDGLDKNVPDSNDKKFEAVWLVNHFAKEIPNAEDFEKYSNTVVTPRYITEGVTGNKLNLPEYMPDEDYEYICQVGNSRGGALTKDEKAVLDSIPDEEIAVYRYIYAKYGKEYGQLYLDQLKDGSSYYIDAQNKAKEYIDNYTFKYGTEQGKNANFFEKLGIAAEQGWDSFFENSVTAMTGDAEKSSANDYAFASARENSNWLGRFALDAVQTGANMAPSILTSIVIGGIAPGSQLVGQIGSIAGSAMMGMSAGGGAYADAIKQGHSEEEAKNYGIIIGALEGGLQTLMGGIGKLKLKVNGQSAGLISRKIHGISNKLLQGVAQAGVNMASEGFEEGLQEFLAPVVASVVFDEKYTPAEAGDIAYAALLGGVMGFFGGEGVDPGLAAEVQRNKQYSSEQAAELASLLISTNPESSYAHQVGQQIINALDRGEVLTNGDIMDISSALAARAQMELVNNTRAENKNAVPDADTAESTSVNTDPAEHTPAEQAVIEEYQNAVDNRLLSWLKRVKGSLAAGDKTAQKMKIVLSAVTDRTAMAVKDVSGIDVTGFSHMMDGSAVIHIEKRHGENGKHDKSMRNVEDIARAQYVLDNFDTCELITDENEIAQLSSGFMDKNNNPAPVVRFSKKVNGTYYVAEAVPDSADKKMHIISAYMQKNKGSIIQALNIEDNSSQQHTSETPLDPIASSTPIITDVDGNSNSEIEQSDAENVEEYDEEAEHAQKPGYLKTVNEWEADINAASILREGKEHGMSVRDIKRLQSLSRLLHRQIRLYTNEAEGADTGGFFDPKTEAIYINAKCDDPVMQTLSHELTHSLEGTSYYDQLAEYVRNNMQWIAKVRYDVKKAEIEAAYEAAKEKGVIYSDTVDADHETVAWFVEHYLLKNEKQIRRLCETKPTLGRRILNWFDRLLVSMGNKKAINRQDLQTMRGLYKKALDEKSGRGYNTSTAREHLESAREGIATGRMTDEQFDAAYDEYATLDLDRNLDVDLSERQHKLSDRGVDNGKNAYSRDSWLEETSKGERSSQNRRTESVVQGDGHESRGTSRGNREKLYHSDSEGREISKNVYDKIAESAIVDEEGKPIALYHGTDVEFDHFEKGDIGFRFGTKQQAEKRVEKKENHIFVRGYLNIKNPVQVSRDVMSWQGAHTALALWDEGILSFEQVNEITRLQPQGWGYDSPASVRLREILADKGYDGLSYPNGFEGEGTSYIAFYDDQIIRSPINEDKNDPAREYRLSQSAQTPTAKQYKLSDTTSGISSMPTKVQNHIAKAENGIAKELANGLSIKTREGYGQVKDILRTISEEYMENGAVADESLNDAFEKLFDLGDTIKDDSYKAWVKNDFTVAINDMLSKLTAVKRFENSRNEEVAAAAEIPQTIEELSEVWEKFRVASRAYDRVMSKHLFTEEDKLLIGRLLRGETDISALENITDNAEAIREAFEARRDYEEHAKVLRAYRKQHNAQLRALADSMLGTALAWRDKGMGIKYERETMERNIRDIVSDRDLANKIIATYITPIHHAEAEANRAKNRYRARVKALKLDSKPLTKKDIDNGRVSEAYAVQFIGEARDNIRRIQESRGRLKSIDGKTETDWKAAMDALWANNPKLDREKIDNAIIEFRNIYDELFTSMNEVRIRNGYEPIPYRKEYFPHFQLEGDGGIMSLFGQVFGISTDILPTSINGMTHTFKPGISYFSHAQERLGFATVFDAVEGFDRYIEGAMNVIYHTDNIQRLRALASQIRYNSTSDGIRAQVDAVLADKTLTEQDKDNRIRDIYEKGRFSLSNFVAHLDEYTNLLAGKKSLSDRTMEYGVGRTAYNTVSKFSGRVAANMISANLGSALTNFIPIVQASAAVPTGDVLKGMFQTLRNIKDRDGIAERSDFIANRRGSHILKQTKTEKASEVAMWVMENIDSFVSESIVRARYSFNLKRGMSEQAAMEEADTFAAAVIAGRSRGAMPTLFYQKNPITKLLTQFQLEVNNQYSYMFKDLPAEVKERGGKIVAGMLLKFLLGSFLYNELYELVVGRRPAFDVLGILNDTVGDFTGYELPNVFKMGYDALLGDGVSGEDFKTDKSGFSKGTVNLVENLTEELPFTGVTALLGFGGDGGRIPISSALPDFLTVWNALTNSEWSAKKKWTEGGEEVFKFVMYTAPHFGGGAFKKFVESGEVIRQGGSYNLTAKGEKMLQYSGPDNIWQAVKSLFLGKTSLPTAQEWINNGFKTLSVRETATYLSLADMGEMEKSEIFRLIKELKTYPSAAEAQRMLTERDISAAAKGTVYYSMYANDSEIAMFDALADMGADYLSLAAEFAAIERETYIDGEGKTKYKSPTKTQKVGALLQTNLDDEEIYTVLHHLNPDKDGTKAGEMQNIDIAQEYGITAGQWATLRYEVLPQFDEDKNKNYTGAEVEKALDAIDDGFEGIVLPSYSYRELTFNSNQLAVLWQLLSGSTSGKNNPYKTSIGNKVAAQRHPEDDE